MKISLHGVLSHFTAAIFLLCLLSPAFSQSPATVEGYVLSVTGKPLEGANVVVLGTGFGASTNAAGYFSIQNMFAGEYTIRVTYLGYSDAVRKGVVVHKDFKDTVNFRLRPTAIPLEEVVVIAAHQRESSAFQEIITAKEISSSPARTVGELLQNLPGVEVVEVGGGSGAKRVSIRGSQSNQVLVVLDGIVLNNPLLGYADLNQIRLDWVEEIRVWKGGNSGRFGSGALGGVIEIISKQNIVDETRARAHFGNFGTFGISPAISGSAKSLKYFLNFDFSREEGDYPYTYRLLDGTPVDDTRLNSDFISRNYFGKLLFEHERYTLHLQANIYNSERGLPGLIFAWSPFSRADALRRILSAAYSLQRQNWQVRLQVSQHLNRSEFRNQPPPDAPLRFRSVPPFHSRFRVLSHQGSAALGFTAFEKHNFELNASVQFDDFEDRDLMTGSAGPIRATDYMSAAGALSSEWRLPAPEFMNRVTIRTALRFDLIAFDNSSAARTEKQFSPRIGLFASSGKSVILNIKANLGRSFRAPTFADLFFQDFRVRGNPGLLPEKSTDFDAGVQLSLPILGRLEWQSAFFRQDVENLIVWELGSFATFQPFNTRALLKGWEYSGSWRTANEKLQISLSHVYLNALNKSGDRTTHNKKLTYRAEHTTKLSVRLNLHFAAVDYLKRWVGPRFVTASNTVRMPAYSVDDVTFNFRKEFNKVKLNFKFSVFNVLNQQYEIVENAPMPGRNWRTGIEFIY
ncbi:MAG: TonB-dependent receptor domain-containing protein [bacterium]